MWSDIISSELIVTVAVASVFVWGFFVLAQFDQIRQKVETPGTNGRMADGPAEPRAQGAGGEVERERRPPQRRASQKFDARLFRKHSSSSMGGVVMMISGCEDAQESADVSNVADFRLPDAKGRAGGACTSTLLNVVFADRENTGENMSFVEVLLKMRTILHSKGYTQVPQLASNREIDLYDKFDFVPEKFRSGGTRRALLIGINYVGHDVGVLSGCHNDVRHMMQYIKDVHGFREENMTVLMDDGEHEQPTHGNLMSAFARIIEESEPGDALFCHFSGHGIQIPDQNGDEEDGYDECLIPVDYKTAGIIRDDDLYEIIVEPLKPGVILTCLMDCCHSGTVLDLPYQFTPEGSYDLSREG